MATESSTGGPDVVITMEEGMEQQRPASSSLEGSTTPSTAGGRQQFSERLSNLASSLRSPGVMLHVGSIDEEMEDYIQHQEAIEAGFQQDVEAPVEGLPAGAPSFRERAVAFEDGGRLGRFLVTKRVGLVMGEPATGHGAAGGSIVDVPCVVVLFGWLTCQDRHLRKYAELYHRLGFPLVLRHTVPPLKVLRQGQRGVVRAAEELYELSQTRLRHAKVVVHYFSNGGAFVHWRLLRLLRRRHRAALAAGAPETAALRRPDGAPASSPADLFPNLAATIFDSSPAAADAEAGAKAMSASQRNAIVKGIVYGCVRFGLEVWGLVQLWTFEKAYLRDMRGDPSTAASLYIYSEADEITDPAIVESCIAERRAYLARERGLAGEALVEGWRIKDEGSHHVCHFPHAPDAYRKQLLSFLYRHGCLPQE